MSAHFACAILGSALTQRYVRISHTLAEVLGSSAEKPITLATSNLHYNTCMSQQNKRRDELTEIFKSRLD